MSNVSDFISPIQLHITLGNLAGATGRVSGWGTTSDSKYNLLITSHFNLKKLHISEWLFQSEETHGLQKVLWSL
jgi:hypothetical protein